MDELTRMLNEAFERGCRSSRASDRIFYFGYGCMAGCIVTLLLRAVLK